MAHNDKMPISGICPQEIKIFLAKGKFIYYLEPRKEFPIFSRFCTVLLTFFLLSVTFQTDAFARKNEKSIKEKTFDEYRIQGYEAQQKGNNDEALSFYAKAVSIGTDRDVAAVFNDMGVIYEQMGLTGKAEESYLESLRANDHYLPACANIASLYKREGDIQKAAYFFKKRVEWGEPGDIWTKKAKEELSELSHRSPEVKKWLLQHESAELTEEMIKKERQNFSDSLVQSDKYFKDGEKLFKAKRYDQALDAYNQALALTPDNPKITRARDQALLESIKENVQQSADSALKMLELGDTVSAKLEFRKILTLIPDEPILLSK